MDSLKTRLQEIAGTGNVIDDAETLNRYAQDQSFVKKCVPDQVVFVESVEQVQAIIREANLTKTPVTPFSSGLNLHG